MSVMLSPPHQVAKQNQDDHWTVEQLYRAYDSGIFPDSMRLEIIHGRITEKMPPGPLYTNLRLRVERRLRAALERQFFMREETPLHIAFDGEPIPDLMFTREEEYGERHPTPEDVVLLIEVADSSADYDLGEKSLLYAQAGIRDYWVALVNELAIVRHRQPAANGYQEVTRLTSDDAISPLAAPEAIWMVTALLGQQEAAEAHG